MKRKKKTKLVDEKGKIRSREIRLVPPYTIRHHQYLYKIYRLMCVVEGQNLVVHPCGKPNFGITVSA